MRTVGEVAELAGVSVRALHHYDELRLLSPSERSEAGYRLYSHRDLERLQEILVWRALGFSLGDIRALLDQDGYDRLSALERQRELVQRDLETRALAERHRAQISRWFYECAPQMHRGLAELYIADDRFAQHYERRAPGLAAYVHDAILANADGQAAVSR
jgi:DNA-binding transcriptional MerR regulator